MILCVSATGGGSPAGPRWAPWGCQSRSRPRRCRLTRPSPRPRSRDTTGSTANTTTVSVGNRNNSEIIPRNGVFWLNLNLPRIWILDILLQVATLSSCCPRPPAPPPLSTGDHDSTQSRIISSEVQGSIEGKCKVIVDQEEIDWKW